jgi:ADP-heptose:LPS heptosyltransferase
MKKILIIRFSAIGDVAMTIPVVYSLARQYPDLDITVLSRESMQPLFARSPDNVHFYGADLKGKHHGMFGLHHLFYALKALHFDYVADFHSVIRSDLFRWRFHLLGLSTARIHKGRAGKKRLTRRSNKELVEQESSFARYADVLARLGFPVKLEFTSLFGERKGDFSDFSLVTNPKPIGTRWVGIAPFAKHEGKIYPLEKMEKVINSLVSNPVINIFLFGRGAHEERVFEQWKNSYQQVVITSGKLSMEGELALISHLDVMISMDSANMHFASLVNTPVVSVWGATHPYCGFMGWRQSLDNAVQINLNCRPCSVFGNKPCYRKDYACLHDITPSMIVERVMNVINR